MLCPPGTKLVPPCKCEKILTQLCRCANIDMPVCGRDNKTYGNPCLMSCAGVQLKHNGRCRPKGNNNNLNCQRIRCSNKYKPVCGNEDITYKNRCIMKCIKGDTLKHKGECAKKIPCIITLEYFPVCGVNGKTYSNMSSLKCDKMDLERKGPCDQVLPIGNLQAPSLAACSCINEEKPVCGVNNKTYGNACLAGCENIQVAYQGRCRQFTSTLAMNQLFQQDIFIQIIQFYLII